VQPQKTSKNNTRARKKKQRRGRRRIEKDSIFPPWRNLTKEVATLTEEMEENLRFSVALSQQERAFCLKGVEQKLWVITYLEC
jgi:hypothetical protein